MNSRRKGIFAAWLTLSLASNLSYCQTHEAIGAQIRCPLCGGEWDGNNHYTPALPDSLPAPKDKEWLKRLDILFVKERTALAQYRKEAEVYRLHLPFSMVIPQLQDHFDMMIRLYRAFGIAIPDPDTTISTANGDLLHDALKTGMNYEKELVLKNEWLVQNATNEKARQILSDILYQTRIHCAMFQHALSLRGVVR